MFIMKEFLGFAHFVVSCFTMPLIVPKEISFFYNNPPTQMLIKKFHM